jgi:hypothetical protein
MPRRTAAGYLIAALAVPVIPAYGSAGQIVLPDNGSATSPNGKYVVRSKRAEDSDDSSPLCSYWWNNTGDQCRCATFLTNAKTQEEKLLYYSDESAIILWSPNSDAFVLNDWEGSSYATAVLFLLEPQFARIDLECDLRESKASIPSIEDADHFYIQGKRWLNNDQLLLQIDGHRSVVGSPSFRFVFLYSLATRRFTLEEKHVPYLGPDAG